MTLFIFLGVKAAALMSQCPEVKPPPVEDGHITEQQLGLRQAEERLYRDYIHRLVKVGNLGTHLGTHLESPGDPWSWSN